MSCAKIIKDNNFNLYIQTEHHYSVFLCRNYCIMFAIFKGFHDLVTQTDQNNNYKPIRLVC